MPKKSKYMTYNSKTNKSYPSTNVYNVKNDNDYGYNENGYTNAGLSQYADQFSFVEQESDELIFIKDSCGIQVQTTDTQAAVSLQVGLQLAIALVISITIGDTDQGKVLAQELFQSFDTEQTNKQGVIIENSREVNITTTDTDIAVNIQVLLQVLVALVAKLDVL